MPCRSDYMEPTRRERESKEAAGLICYVLEKNGAQPPLWATNAADDIYGRTLTTQSIDIIGFLCDMLRGMTPELLESTVYGDLKDKRCRSLADWWERHLEDDKKRQEIEINEQKQAMLRIQALEKLTPEERSALGL